MSSKGDDPVVDDMLRSAQRAVSAAAREQRQLELADPLTAEEIFSAQEELGFGAGMVSVMREARAKRGRPKGKTNRNTADFKNYLSQFGNDPAVTLMRVQTLTPEELVARSRLLDTPKRWMSYHDALGVIVRAAEGLMPYFHSKQPLAVQVGVDGDFALLVPGVNITEGDAASLSAGQFVLEGEFEDAPEGEASDGEA